MPPSRLRLSISLNADEAGRAALALFKRIWRVAVAAALGLAVGRLSAFVMPCESLPTNATL
jgi:hypothetical protein